MKKQAEKWLDFAKIDLLTAEKLLSDEILTQSTAFHLQQCVEKIFKAILENYSIQIPKTHNLERIYALIEEIDSFSITLDEDILDQINDVYIDSRYPGDAGLIPEGKPSLEKINLFYSFAKQVFNNIKEILEEE